MVLFVAHGGDDRHGAGEDGPNDRLEVERPEVFGRAAASAHDDGVHRRQAEPARDFGPSQFTGHGQTTHDFLRSVFTLNEHFDDRGSHAWPTVGHESTHVGQGR